MKLWLLLPSLWMHRLLPCFFYFRKLFFPIQKFHWSSFTWKNLKFNNPLGTAGGLDKSTDLTQGWWTYGPGFVEIGTITPQKQKPHKGMILKRNIQNQALWNYMGFPNKGVDFSLKRLKQLKRPYPTPLFASIGKNRSTPLSQAVEDYICLIKKLHKYVDAFVINISSPNTEKLRELFKPAYFENFLHSMISAQPPSSPPLLLKLSPDLTDQEFLKVIEISNQQGIDGWVICNTTTQRNHLKFPIEGGVSGRPLAQKSKHLLKLLVQYLDQKKQTKLIISSGGVLSPEDVLERLKMGAHLVQVYSALVFYSPLFFEQVYQFSKNHSKKI